VAIFLNLFRDQLGRYGEVDSVADGWHAALEGDGSGLTLVLNADDPSVAQLASVARGEVVTFGVDDPRVALTDVEHASDARFCVCDTAFSYDAVYLGHVGAWRCDGCGRSRGEPDVVARDVVLAAGGASFSLHAGGAAAVPVALPLAGLYSVYNALATVAAAIALGLGVDAAVQALRDAAPVFGRQERFAVDGRDVQLLLAKNPAGLNAVVRSLAAAGDPLTLLMLLNDGVQDGRDVSWIYDADLERLAGRTRAVVASGARANDLALRLHLAGIDPDVVDPDVERALDAALALTPEGSRLDVVPTYTAMIEVREVLARRSGAPRYWEATT
jgi:UDP-N-acetylmuramyl tripeptide synthase